MQCLLLVQTFRLLSIISQVQKQNGMGLLQLIAKDKRSKKEMSVFSHSGILPGFLHSTLKNIFMCDFDSIYKDFNSYRY